MLGEIACINNIERSATAIGQCTLLAIKQNDFLKQNPEVTI